MRAGNSYPNIFTQLSKESVNPSLVSQHLTDILLHDLWITRSDKLHLSSRDATNSDLLSACSYRKPFFNPVKQKLAWEARCQAKLLKSLLGESGRLSRERAIIYSEGGADVGMN